MNAPKNRYGDVLPIERTAVKLECLPGAGLDSTYINANHIRDKAHCSKKNHKKQRYIASQAPTVSTLSDFWRMVWQYKIPVIVMITNLVEKNRVKADIYWPQKIGEVAVYGDTHVKLVSERCRANDVIVRKFLICKRSQPRHSFSYTSTFSSTSEEDDDDDDEELDEPVYINSSDYSDSEYYSGKGTHTHTDPTIYGSHHSEYSGYSADPHVLDNVTILEDTGLGSRSRSGSYESGSLYTPRGSPVMTPVYTFGDCTPPYLAGTPPPLGESLSSSFGSCLSHSSEEKISGEGKFCSESNNDQEYNNDQVGKTVTPKQQNHRFKGEMDFSSTEENDHFPAKEAREKLEQEKREKEKKEQEEKEKRERERKEKEKKTERTCNLGKDCRSWECEEHEVRTCYQLHCTTWPDFGVPRSSQVMREIIAEVDLRKGDPEDPILVHCSAGIGRTGTFLAVHIALARELQGEKIDIKETVSRLRRQRIGMVQSAEQYMFIYKVLSDILKEREATWHPATKIHFDGSHHVKECPLGRSSCLASSCSASASASASPFSCCCCCVANEVSQNGPCVSYTKQEIITELLSSKNLLTRRCAQPKKNMNLSHSWQGIPSPKSHVSAQFRRRSEARLRPKPHPEKETTPNFSRTPATTTTAPTINLAASTRGSKNYRAWDKKGNTQAGNSVAPENNFKFR
eukprot:TRINITY_DN3487_c0_g4_i1.p1 TRINITY_DN3487_c0_g4~~TRINITY_DN3487_c0_g4_i1.p1  ORF type:complete len:754 (-),score=114.66 TRINITY_DN3487_c0_g4_i1:342-2396(-)